MLKATEKSQLAWNAGGGSLRFVYQRTRVCVGLANSEDTLEKEIKAARLCWTREKSKLVVFGGKVGLRERWTTFL